ncbi:MAG: HlyC/CorC family transporter, partial [Armatimonadetes bacterium]|nr:HlyC/CorC family transporter [Armatimonadota bacterium]
EPVFARLLEPILGPLFHALGIPGKAIHVVAFAVAYALVSALHIVIGELAPKSWAIQRPEALSLGVAYPLHWFYWLFKPVILVLNGAAGLLLRLCRIQPASESELAHSEEELRMILTASGESGILKDSEVDLVKHVFEFADKRARDIAVPRVDMVYLDAAWPFERNLKIASTHSFTRFPLCEGDADHVIGMVHVKDLLQLAQRGGGDLRSIAREILTVPETKPIDALLREFQYRKMHMAVVLDEYGGTTGLATLEDVLEEIVGEIYDEFEEPSPEVQPLGDYRFMVDGKALLSDLKTDHAIDIPPNGADTIGGFVLDKMGAIPERGAVLEVGPYRLEVAEMDGQRVRKVLVVAPPPETAAASPEA